MRLIIPLWACHYCPVEYPIFDISSIEKLASNAIIAYSTSTSDLKEMGEKGYNYYRREFDKDKVITKLVNIR